jgi:hypothetical protein
MQGRFADNPAYVEYESRLVALHALDAQGRGESEEADALRDQMDDLSRRLNRPEKDRLSGLSADLYMLQDAEIMEPGGPPVDFDQQLRESIDWNNWGGILSLLRRRPELIFPSVAAAWRARAYDALGHSGVALLFLDYAFRSTPHDPSYLGLRMMFLCRSGRLAEAAMEAEGFLSARGTDALLTIASADVLFQRVATEHDPQIIAEICRRILTVLEPVLRTPGRGAKMPPGYLVIGNLVRAMCLSRVGNPDQTLEAIDAAIQADPGDQVLRQLRDRAGRELDHEVRCRELAKTLDHARDLARRTIPTRSAA